MQGIRGRSLPRRRGRRCRRGRPRCARGCAAWRLPAGTRGVARSSISFERSTIGGVPSVFHVGSQEIRSALILSAGYGGVLAKTDHGRDRRRPASRAAASRAGRGDCVPNGRAATHIRRKDPARAGHRPVVNLNRDAFRSFGGGRVRQVPGAMVSGPAGRASVIEFEEGHAHVSVASRWARRTASSLLPWRFCATTWYRLRRCAVVRGGRGCGNGCSRRRARRRLSW